MLVGSSASVNRVLASGRGTIGHFALEIRHHLVHELGRPVRVGQDSAHLVPGPLAQEASCPVAGDHQPLAVVVPILA